MHRLAASAALGLALAALAAGAEGGNAPLAESKQELQKLKAQGGSGGAPSLKDGLKSGLPAFPASTDSTVSLQRLPPEQLKRESRERGDAQKNWLLNGVNELAKKKDRFGEDKAEVEEAGKIDTADPAYLVKLYEQQRKATAAKSSAADGKALRPNQPDPFAPFLQGWLAGSPGKEQIMADSSRRPDGSVAPLKQTAWSGQQAPPQTQAATVELGATGHGTKSNPYLTGTNPADFSNSGSQPVTPGSATAPATGWSAPQPASSPQPLAEPANNDRKPPPAPLADDKKYFPQLKKF